jgi:starch phosphorylase
MASLRVTFGALLVVKSTAFSLSVFVYNSSDYTILRWRNELQAGRLRASRVFDCPMTTFKDPVCGMMVPANGELIVLHKGHPFRFCSELCKASFLKAPEKYSFEPLNGTPHSHGTRRIAYFSMEVALASEMPTYSGGLGVLAGDTLRSCADLKLPLVAVSLLYRQGYFHQLLDEWGNQSEQSVQWDPTRFARPLPETVQVVLEGRAVLIRAWQCDIAGNSGHLVPLLFLDSDLEENDPKDRSLTGSLYGGDERYRLKQEIVLGLGGIRMLRALSYTELDRFHMNEGHAALLTLELLRERNAEELEWDFNGVRDQCIFTTHTPVPVGHDQFSYDLVKQVLGETVPFDLLQMLAGQDRLNMTLLALNMSGYVNGVAKRHGQISQEMFPGYTIDSITNGIHSVTWTAPSFQELYDRHMPGWRTDPFSLRYAVSIPNSDIRTAHDIAKGRLLEEVTRRAKTSFDPAVLTIGFARRATLYKRADLIFTDIGRLLEIAQHAGGLQFIFSGKAHPKDGPGKDMIRRVVSVEKQLHPHIRIVYLENYDLALAQLLTAGVDLWLNTPQQPLEASGTSGMKAAHNGVPSFSVLDGWWIEGHIEGVTGWSIGPRPAQPGVDSVHEARELYEKLEATIMPLFYHSHERWLDVMRQTITFNASFFNTQRMVQQYAANAYV